MHLSRLQHTGLASLFLLMSFSLFARHPRIDQMGDVVSKAARLSTEAKRLYQATESVYGYSYYGQNAIVSAARDFSVRADVFSNNLSRYYSSPSLTEADFRSLDLAYQSLTTFDSRFRSSWSLQDPYERIRFQFDLLKAYYQSSSSIFNHLRVITLSRDLDTRASRLYRQIEQEMLAYARRSRLSHHEREAIESVLRLAVAARALEKEVTYFTTNSERTRYFADQVVQAYNHAEASIAGLPLDFQTRRNLSELSALIYELESLYGSRSPYPGTTYPGQGGGYSNPNDPFGRGGSQPQHPYVDPYAPGNSYDPCIDPYACVGGPRGTAPSVRIY